MSPSQVKTGSWSSRPIHWYLRHFPPLHLPHHIQPEELPSICDCPGSLGGQSRVLIKSVGGRERGKDPLLYRGGRDLRDLNPAHTWAHHTPTDTKPHISTRGRRCTDTKTQTHRHTQKDTQRHIHTHTEGTHTDAHMRTLTFPWVTLAGFPSPHTWDTPPDIQLLPIRMRQELCFFLSRHRKVWAEALSPTGHPDPLPPGTSAFS